LKKEQKIEVLVGIAYMYHQKKKSQKDSPEPACY